MSTMEPEGPEENLVSEHELKSLPRALDCSPAPQKPSISESQTVIIGRWETQSRRELRQSSPTAKRRGSKDEGLF